VRGRGCGQGTGAQPAPCAPLGGGAPQAERGGGPHPRVELCGLHGSSAPPRRQRRREVVHGRLQLRGKGGGAVAHDRRW